MTQDCCLLCDITVGHHHFRNGEHLFCCLGCQTVYQILQSRAELDNIRDNAFFKQAVKSGLISNPALLDEIRKNQPSVNRDEVEKVYFEIDEMWCPACAEVIKLILLRKKGVLHCVIDYSTDLASVEYSQRHVTRDQIFSEIQTLGYQPSMLNEKERQQVSRSLLFRLGVSSFFSLNIMMFSYPIYATYFFPDETGGSDFFVWIVFLASLPVLLYGGWPIFRRFLTSLKVGIVGMETLIVLGVSSAFGLSLYQMTQGGNHVYFDSMSVIITFVLLGKVIESKAKFSTRECLTRLARAVPKRGRRQTMGSESEFVSIKDISLNDNLIALNGERIVLDGIVVKGQANCDESIMTGEAIPVFKNEGDTVLAGSVVVQGSVTYQVTAIEEATALHQILGVVEREIGHKSMYTRAVDPIVKMFVPVIIIIALGIALGAWIFGTPLEGAIVRAITVLLISCPCAIGIAAPLAESQTLNRLANLGAIVRNRGVLPLLGCESLFVFDKTGTVTEGHFKVISGLEGLDMTYRSALKGLAQQSTHPISLAIAQSICDHPIGFDKIEEVTGRGVMGEISGSVYKLGSAEFVGVDSDGGDQTTVYFSCNEQHLSTLVLGDKIKPSIPSLLTDLLPTKSMLLSGDGSGVVADVAKKCGFDFWKGGVTPFEKRDQIDKLKRDGEIVAMVGDGINDAPALTGADIGFSVVNATDVSIQVSDIMLTTDRLEIIPQIRQIALRGQRIVYQNLFWAFIYNIIGVGLAVSGLLNPLISATAMVLSSLFVLFNARRV